MSVNGEIIQFNTGDTTKTHTIFIEQDQICETEFFFSNIVLDSGIQEGTAGTSLDTIQM